MLKKEDFKLPEDLERYKVAVRQFCKTDLQEFAREIEKTKKIPAGLQPALRDAGLLWLRLPKKYGGYEITFSQYWPILYEVAKVHGSIRMFVHEFNGIWGILDKYGTEEQKKKWFPETWAKGQGYPTFAITEPDNGTGVDIRTTACKEGNNWVINGKKTLITYADISLPYFVVVYTGDRSLGAKSISMLIVEKGNPGLELVPHGELMGIKGCYHASMVFNNCKVPLANLVGKEGEGLDIALRTFLDPSRLSIAVSITGQAERCMELAVEYANRKMTFGKFLADRQAIQQMMGDMGTDLYAARCMIADCARLFDEGKPIVVEASMAKLFAIGMSQRVSDTAFNVMGGVGYSSDSEFERHYRDIRAPWFEEGAPTIQRLVVGREMLGKKVRQIGK